MMFKRLVYLLVLVFIVSSLSVVGFEKTGESLDIPGDKDQIQITEEPALAQPKEDAEKIQDEFGGDLDEAMIGPMDEETIGNEPIETEPSKSDAPSEANYEKPKEEPVITPIERPKDGGVLAQPDIPRDEYVGPDTTGALPEFNTFGLLAAGLLGASAWLWVRKR